MFATDKQETMSMIMKNYGIQELADKLWEERREFFNPMSNWSHACSLAMYMEFDVGFGLGGTSVTFYDPTTGRHKTITKYNDADPFKAAMLAICEAAVYLGSINN